MKAWTVVLSGEGGEVTRRAVQAHSSSEALSTALAELPPTTDARSVFVRVTRAQEGGPTTPERRSLLETLRKWRAFRAHSPHRPFKVCGCGAQYSWAQWGKLVLSGVQHTEDEERAYLTEHRQCRCGSTLAVEWVEEP